MPSDLIPNDRGPQLRPQTCPNCGVAIETVVVGIDHSGRPSRAPRHQADMCRTIAAMRPVVDAAEAYAAEWGSVREEMGDEGHALIDAVDAMREATR